MAGEFATSVGFSAAQALIDLAKAVEHIQFSHLWRMGVTHDFPPRLLWCLIGYGGPRFLLVRSGGLVDSVAAVVAYDTQFQAVGKSHQVSQQLQRAIHLSTEEVVDRVVSSRNLEHHRR